MEINGIWTENHRIEANMVDLERSATWATLANIFQNAAGNHANFRQLGFYDLQKIGMVWVLNRLKINVLAFPKWLDTVRLETWVSAMQPFSHRHFALFDAVTHQPLCYAYSLWIPIDTATHKPRRIPPSDFDVLLLPDKEKGCALPEKLKDFEKNPTSDSQNSPYTEGVSESSNRVVKFSELDLAGHVNNVKYIEWLLDDLFADGKLGGFNTLEINYLGETFLGDSITVYSKKTASQADFVVKKTATNADVLRARLLR